MLPHHCQNAKRFEALEILEALQNVSHDRKHEREAYYRLVYQTARSKLELLNEYFRSLLLRLLGDKDHQRVFDTVTKVEKNFRWKNRATPSHLMGPFAVKKLGAFLEVPVLSVFIVRILRMSEPIVLRGSQLKKQMPRIPLLPNRFVVRVL